MPGGAWEASLQGLLSQNLQQQKGKNIGGKENGHAVYGKSYSAWLMQVETGEEVGRNLTVKEPLAWQMGLNCFLERH